MLDCFKVPDEIAIRVPYGNMHSLVTSIFECCEMTEEGAKHASDALLYADLRGIDSHGVSNMLPKYVSGLRSGVINPKPNLSCSQDFAATLAFDCDQGLGLEQGHTLMSVAIDRARTQGVAYVTGYNGNHYGTCAHFVHQAVTEDLIGISMTTGSLKVTPTFGSEQLVGLNPLGFGVPAGTEIPFIFDAAMSAVASNKIKTLQRLDRKVLPGWIADAAGNPVMESINVPQDFMILPLGGTRELGSHKGFSLAMMIEILCGVLTGSGGGPHRHQGHAHCFIAIDIARFSEIAKFKHEMDTYLRAILDCKPAPGHARVIYAGVLEHEAEIDRRNHGIPYHPEVVSWLQTLAHDLNINHNLPVEQV